MSAPAGLQAFQGAASRGSGKREFYLLRRYSLRAGPQATTANEYFRDALVPALNRAEITPVGVFTLTIGLQTPATYVLMPSQSLEALVQIEDRLLQDAEYQKAGAAFLGATNKEPAFDRIESSLMRSFEGYPSLTVPPSKAAGTPRIFEMRNYEEVTERVYRLKVDQFHSGSFDAFKKVGFDRVFFGEVLVGSRMPKLIYMISCANLAERDQKWQAFFATPEWKRVSTDPKFAIPGLVANNTQEILAPTPYSQI